MATLFAFGDSFTQGVGLEKHVQASDVIPSDSAWPKITADILDMRVSNLAVGGHSNKAIAYDVTNNVHNIASDDVVVIMWSDGFYRNMILTDDGNIQFCPSTDDENLLHIKNFVVEHMSSRDNIQFDQSMLIMGTDAVVRQKTQNVLHVMVKPLEWEDDDISGHDFLDWQHILSQPWIGHLFQLDLALFNLEITPWYTEYDKHYSREQHADFSQRLSKVITEKFLTK